MSRTVGTTRNKLVSCCCLLFIIVVVVIVRYNCNRYNESDAKSARDAQMGSRAALERYLFYCNRYMNHLRSSKMEAKVSEEKGMERERERN